MNLSIRTSRDADIPAITAIYAHHVLTGTGTFETSPPDASEMVARRADVLAKGLPYLVAEDENAQVLGFAYCNWFKPRPAYRYSAEDSIYLAASAQGRGVGSQLLQHLCQCAQDAGVRKLIAVIGDSANAGSIGVHRKAGFSHVGVMRDVGWKFERWLDVVLMDKTLGLGSSEAPQ